MWENHLAGTKISSMISYLCSHKVRRYECQCVPYIWPGMPGKVNYPIMNVCSLFLSQAHKNGGKNIMDENTTALSHSPTPGLQETCRPCKSQAQRSCRRAALPPLSLRLKTNRGNQPSSETCSVIAGLFVCCWWNSLNLTIRRRTQRWRAVTLLGYLIHSSGRLIVSVLFSSDSPLRCWYSLFPTVPPPSCQHLLLCTPVQYGNLVSECRVFAFAEVGRCESPVSKAQTAEQRGRLVVTAERMY